MKNQLEGSINKGIEDYKTKVSKVTPGSKQHEVLSSRLSFYQKLLRMFKKTNKK